MARALEYKWNTLFERDGVTIAQVESVTITALEDSEILLADLA